MTDENRLHIVYEEKGNGKARRIGASILLPFVSAIIATTATIYFDVTGHSAQQDAFKATHSAQVSQFNSEQSRQKRELEALNKYRNQQSSFKRAELIKTLVRRLEISENFNTKKSTIQLISTVFGVSKAIELESYYRSGATIRGLQSIAAMLDRNTDNESKKLAKKLKDVLDDVPLAVFIDSSYKNNVYCSESKGTQRTNIDDIFPIVRDLSFKFLSVRINWNEFGSNDAKKLANKVVSSSPELIVIHHGAFEGSSFHDDVQNDSNKAVSKFLRQIFSNQKHAPSVIIYSRAKKFQKALPNLARDLGSKSPYFKRMGLEVLKSPADESDNRDCFSAGKPNGEKIREAVERALAAQEPYRFGLK